LIVGSVSGQQDADGYRAVENTKIILETSLA
jgi:hypothetical protein